MASTNKTERLRLSQFIDTDKPAWLTDYNNDMATIDDYCAHLKDSADVLENTVEKNRDLSDERNQAILDAIDNIDATISNLQQSVQTLNSKMRIAQNDIEELQTQMASVLNDIRDIKAGEYLNNMIITTNMLADHSVTTNKLAYNAVTTDEILNGTIQYEDLSSQDCLPDIKRYVNS